LVLKRSEMRGQQGHNSFNQSAKAAIGIPPRYLRLSPIGRKDGMMT